MQKTFSDTIATQKYFEISGYSDGETLTVYAGVVHYSKILALTANRMRYANDPEVMPETSPGLLYPTVILTYLEEAMCFVPG